MSGTDFHLGPVAQSNDQRGWPALQHVFQFADASGERYGLLIGLDAEDLCRIDGDAIRETQRIHEEVSVSTGNRHRKSLAANADCRDFFERFLR